MAAAANMDLKVLLIITLSNVSPSGSSTPMLEGIAICSNASVIRLTHKYRAKLSSKEAAVAAP
jgi:hypothetical protein